MMLDEDMEAIKSHCTGRNDDICEVFCFPRSDARTRFIEDVDLTIGPQDTYVKENLEQVIRKTDGLPSFSELLGSGKIVHEHRTGSFSIGKECMFPFECGGPGLLLKEYRRAGHEDLVHDAIHRAAYSIGENVLNDGNGGGDRLSILRTLLSGLGYGVPFFSQSEGGVDVSIICPPVTRFGPQWQVWELEGFLSAALERPVSTRDFRSGRNYLEASYTYS